MGNCAYHNLLERGNVPVTFEHDPLKRILDQLGLSDDLSPDEIEDELRSLGGFQMTAFNIAAFRPPSELMVVQTIETAVFADRSGVPRDVLLRALIEDPEVRQQVYCDLLDQILRRRR
tara:strand:+ start:7064 stop:7417 length:354 start_codon:yes stop_codon:yes gene_type:complete